MLFSFEQFSGGFPFHACKLAGQLANRTAELKRTPWAIAVGR